MEDESGRVGDWLETSSHLRVYVSSTSSSANMESKAIRDREGLLNPSHQQWCEIRVLCSPPILEARIGVLIRLESGDGRKAVQVRLL